MTAHLRRSPRTFQPMITYHTEKSGFNLITTLVLNKNELYPKYFWYYENITNKKHIKLQVNVYAGIHFIYDLICFIYR